MQSERRDFKMCKKVTTIIGVLVLLVLVLVTNVAAQEPCTQLTIRNNSAVSLDREDLCEAATPWINAGFQVYIFLTDYDPPDEENAWFGKLDEVEQGFGIWDPRTQVFGRSAIAFEATTVTTHPWGQNISFGEDLFSTPLYRDQVVRSRIKGQFKNDLAALEPTQAFVNALKATYGVAFPHPTPTAKPIPTVIVTGPTTQVKVDFGPIVRGLGLLFLFGLLAAGGYVLYMSVFLPWIEDRREKERIRAHIVEVWQRVGLLYEAAEFLFRGENPEQTKLWEMFSLNGGTAYEDLAVKVRGLIVLAREAIEEVSGPYLSLEERFGEISHLDRDRLVDLATRLEELYLLLIGTDPQIRGMSDEQMQIFVDPLAAGLVRSEQAQPLINQAQALQQRLSEQPLQIAIEYADEGSVDSDGVFGIAARVKREIDRLSEAQRLAPQRLETARKGRAMAASLPMPQGLSSDEALLAVDHLLARAEEESEAGRWLNVVSLAEQASVLAGNLAVLLDGARLTVEEYHKRLGQTQAIAERGFTLAFFFEAHRKCEEIKERLYARIRDGQVADAERSIENLDDASRHLLEQAEALVAAHESNQQRLVHLTQEVARVSDYFEEVAEGSWQALVAYPESNWRDLVPVGASSPVDTAGLTLAKLMDDPSDSEDMASSIALMNSLRPMQQRFEDAASGLDEAFASLNRVEANLKAITARLEEVQQIEQSITGAIQQAEQAIQQAKGRRREHPEWVDNKTDELLASAGELLEKARASAANREFLLAHRQVVNVRQAATKAYKAADAQIEEIAELFARLEDVHASAARLVTRALSDQANLPPAAQVASTAGMCISAQEALKAARVEEAQVVGLEDHNLSAALRKAIDLYNKVIDLARKAQEQIADDLESYRSWVAKAASALQEAEEAIDAARRLTADSDASGAGRTSLRQARSTLMSMPAEDSPLDSYRSVADAAERAKELAEKAAAQARRRIREAEEERAAAERRRQEARRRQERVRAAARRTASSASRSRATSGGFRSRTTSGGSRGRI